MSDGAEMGGEKMKASRNPVPAYNVVATRPPAAVRDEMRIIIKDAGAHRYAFQSVTVFADGSEKERPAYFRLTRDEMILLRNTLNNMEL